MKDYGIDKLGIDRYLWDVQMHISKKQGRTLDESDILVYPLRWYIATGRASASFLRQMVKVKPFVMGRLLVKNDGATDDVIRKVKAKIGYKENA